MDENESNAVESQGLVDDDEPIGHNEDENLYSEFVDQWERHDEENADQMELVPFELTDEDEREENVEMGMGGEEEEDRPIVPFDIENPTMSEGHTFPSMHACKYALATFCIHIKRDFIVEKSDPTRLRVHCANKRCGWRLHASIMRNSSVIQVKVNSIPHTCPTCKNAVDPAFGEDEHWGAENAGESVAEASHVAQEPPLDDLSDVGEPLDAIATSVDVPSFDMPFDVPSFDVASIDVPSVDELYIDVPLVEPSVDVPKVRLHRKKNPPKRRVKKGDKEAIVPVAEPSIDVPQARLHRKKNPPKKRVKKGDKEAIVPVVEPSIHVPQTRKKKRGKEVVHTTEDSPAKNIRASQRIRKTRLVMDL